MIVVAIPYYNGQKFLAAAIQSVVSDTSADVRVVVVDDASEEAPDEIVASFPAHRVFCHRNPVRLGMIGNHNRCLDFNTGDYFKILSQDDELVSGAISRQVAALEANSRAVFVAGPREIIRSNGRYLMMADHGLRGLVDRATVCRALAWSGTNVIGEPASVLIRGEVLCRGARFPENPPWLLDVLMWLQLLEHGPALMVEEPAARFRLSAQSYSVGLGWSQVDVFSKFLDELAQEGEIGPWLCRFGKMRCALNAVLRQWLYRFAGV